jgi:hypothetical protein
MNCRNTYVYMSNKLYELPEQICIPIEQILQTTKTNICTIEKLYEPSEQILSGFRNRGLVTFSDCVPGLGWCAKETRGFILFRASGE